MPSSPPLPAPTPTSTPPLRRSFVLLMVPLLAAGIWWLWSHDPREEPGLFLPCLFRHLTGFHCLGCGSTRAGHALLHGRVFEAAGQNLFFVLVLPWFGWLLLSRTLPWIFGRAHPRPSGRIAAWTSWIRILPLLLLVFWIWRNLPVPLGAWLAPD